MSTIRTSHRRTAQPSRTTQPISVSATGTAKHRLNLGSLTDAASIQQAISVVICAVASGDLEADRARLILYGLRIASTNAKQLGDYPKKVAKNEIVESVADEAMCEALPPEERAEEPSSDDEAEYEAVLDESSHESTTETASEPSDEEAAAVSARSQTTQPQGRPGEVYIPPSCFAPAHKIYQGNARDRILSFKQQQRT